MKAFTVVTICTGTFIMAPNVSVASVTYLQSARSVSGEISSGSNQDSFAGLGYWDGSITVGRPPESVGVNQRSTLADSGIEFYGASTGGTFTTGSSSLFAKVRLTEQTLITFTGSFVRFGVPGGSEISASIVGGDYNFSFAALDDQSPNGSFGGTNVLLQPGDYDINLLSRSINFEVPALTFNLTFTTVPAPGAAGLAMVGVGAAGLRRSRRED